MSQENTTNICKNNELIGFLVTSIYDGIKKTGMPN